MLENETGWETAVVDDVLEPADLFGDRPIVEAEPTPLHAAELKALGLVGVAPAPAPLDAKAWAGHAVMPAAPLSTTPEPKPALHPARRSRGSAQQILQRAVDLRETKPEPHCEGAVWEDALAGEEG